MTRDLRQASDDYRDAAGGLLARLRRSLIGVALMAEAQARENATSSPRARTGHLRRSIAGVAETGTSSVAITLTAGKGSTETYASAQEYGALIRPKRGRFLAMPVGPALTGAGVARYPGPRAVPGLHFVPTRGGAGGLLVKDVGGRNARADIYFVLLRQVRISPKRYIGRAIDTIRPVAAERIGEALRSSFEGA